MMKQIKAILALIWVCAVIGCSTDGPVYLTDHPDEGKIILHTDWSNRGEEVEIPATFSIEIDTYKVTVPTADTYTVPQLFMPGTYRAYIYNPVPEVTVANGVATVGPVTDTFIPSLSAWFFTCVLDATLEADTDHDFTAVMTQQARRLTLFIEFPADDVDRVSEITATLSGVAGAWDFTTNEPAGSAVNIPLSFSRQTQGVNAGKWAATVLLLGITGEEQWLTGTISYGSGIPTSQALKSELTDGMAGFNADKKTPLALQGKLDDHSISGAIEEWERIEAIFIGTD